MKRFFLNHQTCIKVFFVGLFIAVISPTSAYFQDISTTHPNFQAIQFLQRNNIVEGYKVSADTRIFKSTQAVTRAEALKMLLLTTNTKLNTAASKFPDVPAKSWFNPYVQTATQNGIVKGFQDGKFYPNAQVTKVEMLKMALIGFDAPINEQAAQNAEANWYEPFINLSEKLRVIDSKTNPQKPLTRGEVAEILFRTHHAQKENFTKPYIYSGSGKASHYGGNFHGKSTANGEIYDKNALTAAHRTLPFGTRVKVWLGENKDQHVIVRINDRGPYHKTRILDLSEKAFSELAPLGQGILEINFEVYTAPNQEAALKVPDEIRSKFSAEAQNLLVPEPVVEALQKNSTPRYITQKKPATLEYGPRMFQNSIAQLSETFFEDIRLYKPFPQKIRTGEVIVVSGQTKKDTHQKITFFLQPKNSNNTLKQTTPIEFSQRIQGRHFFLPILVTTPGKYQFGMVLDNQRDSKMADVEVAPSDVKRTFPRSTKKFNTPLTVTTVPEKQEVTFAWNETDQTILHKIEFSSPESKKIFKTVFIPGSLQKITLPYQFFNSFAYPNDAITVDLLAAESKDGTFDFQQSNWEKAGYKNFTVTKAFQDTETADISIKNFKRFFHTKNAINFYGSRNSQTKFKPNAYIKLPNQQIITQPLYFGKNQEFRLSFTPSDWGIYHIQIVDVNGKTVFNRAIYVFKQDVLPVINAQKSNSNPNIKGSNDLLIWTNQQRTSNLKSDNQLNIFAQKYAEKMAKEDFISHTTPNGVTFEARLKMANIKGSASENLAFGTNKTLALQSLLNSPNHLKNMTQPHWTKLGVGFAQNKKGVYVVQVFQ